MLDFITDRKSGNPLGAEFPPWRFFANHPADNRFLIRRSAQLVNAGLR
jgi:hypothetical protein